MWLLCNNLWKSLFTHFSTNMAYSIINRFAYLSFHYRNRITQRVKLCGNIIGLIQNYRRFRFLVFMCRAVTLLARSWGAVVQSQTQLIAVTHRQFLWHSCTVGTYKHRTTGAYFILFMTERLLSSGMLCRAVLRKLSDVSELFTASIIRAVLSQEKNL
jgi:hypothetical protein